MRAEIYFSDQGKFRLGWRIKPTQPSWSLKFGWTWRNNIRYVIYIETSTGWTNLAQYYFWQKEDKLVLNGLTDLDQYCLLGSELVLFINKICMTSIDFYYLTCLYFTIIIFLHFRYFFRFFRVIFWPVSGGKVENSFWVYLFQLSYFVFRAMSNINVLHTFSFLSSGLGASKDSFVGRSVRQSVCGKNLKSPHEQNYVEFNSD